MVCGWRLSRGVRSRRCAGSSVGAEVLRTRARQVEADGGTRTDILSSQEREEIRKLRRRISSCVA